MLIIENKSLNKSKREILKLLMSRSILVYGTDEFIEYLNKEIIKSNEEIIMPFEKYDYLDIIRIYRKEILIRRTLKLNISEFNRLLMLTNILKLDNRNICIYAVLSKKKEISYFKSSCINLIEYLIPVLKEHNRFLNVPDKNQILSRLLLRRIILKLNIMSINLNFNFEIKPIYNITLDLANLYYSLTKIIGNSKIEVD